MAHGHVQKAAQEPPDQIPFILPVGDLLRFWLPEAIPDPGYRSAG